MAKHYCLEDIWPSAFSRGFAAILSGAALLIAASMPAPLLAQAYQCRTSAPLVAPRISPSGKQRIMPVTGYTLALSWSPEFCKPRRDNRAHNVQCSGENGLFGFVVHGLWPNGARSFPQWCASQPIVTPDILRQHICMMPSTRLMARQWAKHGTCMVKRPETYFGIARILWDSLRFPDYDRISREDELTAGRIREAFVRANPGWSARAVGVKLNERGWLTELRLCYSRRFRPERCNDRRWGARNDAAAKIWRGL